MSLPDLSSSASPKIDILIVDDTPNNLRLLSQILSAQGYAVRKAMNGTLALKAVQVALPDLVLLDINMPDLDGYGVCQALQQNPKTANIPIIFISALDDVLDKVKAFEVGGVDYITKPFEAAEVLVRVKNQLMIQAQQRQLAAQNLRLQEEQAKSERLLLNILPAAIATQLKSHQEAIIEKFEEASFLFADLVSFTAASAVMPPTDVVELLNEVFLVFDTLAERYGVEKIRTIGDNYFVASGVPIVRPDHAQALANMALEMQAVIQHFHWSSGQSLQLRIGLNTGGPVVGAVIGRKKFAYDVWGDTVNIASRMESSGLAGKIQVTMATYERLKADFVLEERGTIAVKGKGEMQTYWLTGRKRA
jgi:class 3 adenylate cyclase